MGSRPSDRDINLGYFPALCKFASRTGRQQGPDTTLPVVCQWAASRGRPAAHSSFRRTWPLGAVAISRPCQTCCCCCSRTSLAAMNCLGRWGREGLSETGPGSDAVDLDPFVRDQPSRGFTTSRPAILRPWLKSPEKRRAQRLRIAASAIRASNQLSCSRIANCSAPWRPCRRWGQQRLESGRELPRAAAPRHHGS